MRCPLVAAAAILAGCAGGPPPWTETSAPVVPPRPVASARPSAAASSDDWPLLDRVALRGPAPSITELCPDCVQGSNVRVASPIEIGTIAVGRDRAVDQPADVRTTFLALRRAGAWWLAPLFREGRGVTHLEIFNPKEMNGGAPTRTTRATRYDGQLLRTWSLVSEAPPSELLGVGVSRVDGHDRLEVLVVCGAAPDEGVRCAELGMSPEAPMQRIELVGDELHVVFLDGTAMTNRVFGD